jgi:hypothetical protein
MAHIIALPVSFEFRTIKVKWREKEARIVGLSFNPFGEWGLRAEATAHGRRVSADLSQRDVPPRLWELCSDAVDQSRDPDDWEQVAEQICSDFRPRLFFASIQDDSEERSLPADACNSGTIFCMSLLMHIVLLNFSIDGAVGHTRTTHSYKRLLVFRKVFGGR